MQCPHCSRCTRVIKKGSFLRKNHEKSRSQRFYCFNCKRNFSAGTGTLSHRQLRPDLDRHVFFSLTSGVSQRRAARLIGTTQTTVARKLQRLAFFARKHRAEFLKNMPPVSVAVFDDMETFEHSKCKPVSITVAVEEGSRLILKASASQMPAKGRLAKIALKRYGYRRDKRRKSLDKVLLTVARVGARDLILKSDKCPRYAKAVRRCKPGAVHETCLSRRACVVGQGELKAGGFDPLFSLNHSCAMIRDNIKRLTRKTWCTTKRIDRLQCLLDIYTCYHNEWILMPGTRSNASGRSFNEVLGPPQLALWTGAAG